MYAACSSLPHASDITTAAIFKMAPLAVQITKISLKLETINSPPESVEMILLGRLRELVVWAC